MADKKWLDGIEVGKAVNWWNVPRMFGMLLYVLATTFCEILSELKEIKTELRINNGKSLHNKM